MNYKYQYKITVLKTKKLIKQFFNIFLIKLLFIIAFGVFLSVSLYTLLNVIPELNEKLTNEKITLEIFNNQYKSTIFQFGLFLFFSVLSILLYFWIKYYEISFWFQNLKKGKIQTEKFSYFLLLLPIYSFFYQKKISTKLTILTNDFLISLDDYDLNYYLSILKSEKIRGIFNKHFKISIMDVSLGSLLLALFIIATVLLKLTPLRFVSFNFEFLFAIVYAYLFRYVKGIFLAFLSDALGMVVTGTIGQWYWMYALSPIFIVIFSSLLFDLFQRNKKITLVISILMLIGSFVLLGALFFIKISQTEGNDFRISSIFNLKSLPIYVGYILFSVGLMITLLLVSLSIWLLFTKDSKRKQNLTRLIFLIALVVSVVVIVRWIWGPYAWINFSMYIGRMRSATYANDKDWYFGLMILIALKSFIAMPIYVFFLFFILSPLEFLKKRYFEQNLKLKY